MVVLHSKRTLEFQRPLPRSHRLTSSSSKPGSTLQELIVVQTLP